MCVCDRVFMRGCELASQSEETGELVRSRLNEVVTVLVDPDRWVVGAGPRVPAGAPGSPSQYLMRERNTDFY